MPPRLRHFAAVIFAVTLGLTPPAAAQIVTLRHDFPAGLHRTYDLRRQTLDMPDTRTRSDQHWRVDVWCVAHDDRDPIEQTSELWVEIHAADEAGQDGRVEWLGAHLTVTPRGEQSWNDLTRHVADEFPCVRLLFAPLPDALGASDHWTSSYDAFGERYEYTARPRHPGHAESRAYEISAEARHDLHDLLRCEQSGRMRFNVAAGAVDRVEWVRRDRRRGVERRSRLQLVNTERLEVRSLARFRLQWERVMRALRVERRTLREFGTRGTDVETGLQRIDRLRDELVHDLESSRLPALIAFGRERRNRWLTERAEFGRLGRLATQWLAHRAADWSLQSPDGATVTSEDFGDELLIEYFWSVDTPSSITSLELLTTLRARYLDEPVAFVCINLDHELELSGRIARRFAPGLTHVLSGPPLDGPAPRKLPLVRILDRDRIVLAVLFNDMTAVQATLERLLPAGDPDQ